MKQTRIQKLRTMLSRQWNLPKEKNLRRDSDGNITDSRIPRNYELIKSLQKEIN